MTLIKSIRRAPMESGPLTLADIQSELEDLWKQVGDDQPARGIVIAGPRFTGSMFLGSDGVWRGQIHHSERGVFSASRVGDDGPIVIEGW